MDWGQLLSGVRRQDKNHSQSNEQSQKQLSHGLPTFPGLRCAAQAVKSKVRQPGVEKITCRILFRKNKKAPEIPGGRHPAEMFAHTLQALSGRIAHILQQNRPIDNNVNMYNILNYQNPHKIRFLVEIGTTPRDWLAGFL